MVKVYAGYVINKLQCCQDILATLATMLQRYAGYTTYYEEDMLATPLTMLQRYTGYTTYYEEDMLAPPLTMLQRYTGYTYYTTYYEEDMLATPLTMLRRYRGFWTRMVYLDYITCLRYTVLVWNPRYAGYTVYHDEDMLATLLTMWQICRLRYFPCGRYAGFIITMNWCSGSMATPLIISKDLLTIAYHVVKIYCILTTPVTMWQRYTGFTIYHVAWVCWP